MTPKAGSSSYFPMAKKSLNPTRRGLIALLLALGLLSPVQPAAAASKGDGSRRREAVRHEHKVTKRREPPHNARYKNPSREHQVTKRREPPRNARYKNPPRQQRDRGHERRDGAPYGKHDGYKRDHGYDHGRGHEDKRHHKSYSRHGYGHYAYHPPRIGYYHYYTPYYAPLVVAYPYYCDLCDLGFHAEHLFYDHLCAFHHVPRAIIPSILFRHGGTFFFAWW